MNPAAPTDPELLADWLDHRREAAFRELVVRYAGLVQMTARRTCGDESLATEAAQLTFIALAQKAKALVSCASLGGWLHQTAMLQAKNLLRKSQREHRKRELLQTAMETESPASSPDAWQDLQPVLDDALAALSAKDREALLLRFYRSLSVKEIAATLGIATDAAQKRVDRATDRLRGKLLRRGCQTGGSLSAVMLAGFAGDAQAAAFAVPLFTAKAIAAGAVSSGAFTAATAFLTASAMKTTFVALPLVVLLVGCVWLSGQFQSIAELERQNEILHQHLAAGTSTMTTAAKRATPTTGLERKPIDWEKIARQLDDDSRLDVGNLTTTGRLREELDAMNASELVAALDEIAAAHLSRNARLVLECTFGFLLFKKEPELGLARCIRGRGEEYWRLLFADLFEGWAKQDPARAVAWLDHQLAAGAFDSKKLGGGRDIPAGMLDDDDTIRELLLSAPDAAALLLSVLPEDRRFKVLIERQSWAVAPDHQAAWAELARRHLPKQDAIRAIAAPASRMCESASGLSSVNEYLRRIDATPDERNACIMDVAANRSWTLSGSRSMPTIEDFDALRAWVASQAPEQVEPATARALAALCQDNTDYPEVAEIALHYHATSHHDELLLVLLRDSLSGENRALAHSIAARLSDPAQRAEYLKKINK